MLNSYPDMPDAYSEQIQLGNLKNQNLSFIDLDRTFTEDKEFFENQANHEKMMNVLRAYAKRNS